MKQKTSNMSMDKLKNNKKESISKAIKMSTLAKIKNFISTSKFTKKKSRFASNEKFGKSAGDISKILKGIGSTVSNVHIMYRVSPDQNNMRNRDDFPEIVLLNCKTPSPERDPKIENELKRKKWKEMREFLLCSAYNKVKLFKNHMDFELDNSDNEKEDSNLAFNPQINAQK